MIGTASFPRVKSYIESALRWRVVESFNVLSQKFATQFPTAFHKKSPLPLFSKEGLKVLNRKIPL